MRGLGDAGLGSGIEEIDSGKRLRAVSGLAQGLETLLKVMLRKVCGFKGLEP